jgi:hypothetical protein
MITQALVFRKGIVLPPKTVSAIHAVYKSIWPAKRSFIKIRFEEIAETLK